MLNLALDGRCTSTQLAVSSGTPWNGCSTCPRCAWLLQVAINWCMCKGTLPIPGAKNAQQAAELAGAMGWRMSDDQVSALDKESDKVTVSAQGAPFEQW